MTGKTPEDSINNEVEIDTVRGMFTARVNGPLDGRVVLMLHGFPDVPHTFDSLAGRMAERGFRTVAPYMRGYQPSPPFPNPADGDASVFEQLGRDTVALADVLSPDRPIALVGHDNAAFTTYYALSQAPERFSRAVTMTAGHPAAVFANTMKLPHQLWKSRYAFLFQIPKLSDWIAERQGFHYLHELWERWSAPGWHLPDEHWAIVRGVLEKSWPAPLEHYREMAFSGPTGLIATPTLYLFGAEDGCVEPEASKGQEKYFSGEFLPRTIEGAGHFMHLEKPDVVEPIIVEWVAGK